mgnify:CR=1 FL=1
MARKNVLYAQSGGVTPVINATGIILHTGLGRAPMAEAAVEAMTDVARHYAPVELVRRAARGEVARAARWLAVGAGLYALAPADLAR